MRPSFRDYVSLLGTNIEALDEAVVNELWDKILGKPTSGAATAAKPAAGAVDKRTELQRLRDLERERLDKKMSAARDAKWAATRKAQDPHGDVRQVGTSLVRPTGQTSTAATGRAGELEWRDRKDKFKK